MARQRLTYTTDLTDEEWQILKPLLPPEKSGGRPRKYPIREVLNGIQYVLRGGCAWRRDGTWVRIHDQLRERVRTQMGRHPQPSGAIIDAQTVQTTEQGGRTATMAPKNLAAASAISSLTQRVSSCVSSSIPPI